VQSHECFLDQVLSDAKLADEPERIAQEWRFQSCEELLDRFPSGRLGAGLVWLHYGHARRLCTIMPVSSSQPGVLITKGHVSALYDTGTGCFLDEK
jgi:hypothetical protein